MTPEEKLKELGYDLQEPNPYPPAMVAGKIVGNLLYLSGATPPSRFGTTWKGRVVVLMDDSTAGPAEILAAALRDRAQAKTVGETTVGMAIIQRGIPTEEGGTLFMTVGRYVSPSGQTLGGKGLPPDERVIVFPGEAKEKDQILERGLEVIRGSAARKAA